MCTVEHNLATAHQICTVIFHLYNILEKVKLVYGVAKYQSNGCLKIGMEIEKWHEEIFWNNGNVYILIQVGITKGQIQ